VWDSYARVCQVSAVTAVLGAATPRVPDLVERARRGWRLCRGLCRGLGW
jgi:hypothetical protein